MESEHARDIAERIARGHAFQEHVIEKDDFPEIRTREEFADLIRQVLIDPSAAERPLQTGRHAFWSDALQMVVIVDEASEDAGTAFRPSKHKAYFRGLI